MAMAMAHCYYPLARTTTISTMSMSMALVLAMALLLLFHHDDDRVRVVSAQLEPGDLAALQSVRAWLHENRPNDNLPPGPPAPSFFSTWDPRRDPCTYDGVICDIVSGRERVVGLNLGFGSSGTVGLAGRLHPAINNLSALVQLTVSPGHIGGSIPEGLAARLGSLQNLGLSHNLLTGPIPRGLGSLPALASLDLSFNRLTGAIPPSIPASRTLLSLNLAHNRLSGEIPGTFDAASSILTHLDLKRNLLTGALPDELPASLAFLDASRNRLSGSTLLPTRLLARLEFLDLSRNQLSGPIPDAVFALPALSCLVLSKNQLSGALDPRAPVSIATLDLSFNQLGGGIPSLFAPVQNLYLNNNRFRGPVPPDLLDRVMSGSMRTLYVQHNFLTGIAMSPWDRVPDTASVCATYNCVVMPMEASASCPAKARGTHRRTRPPSQCGLCRLPPAIVATTALGAPAPAPAPSTPSTKP